MHADARVDAYLARLPSEQRDLLQAFRDRVKGLLPRPRRRSATPCRRSSSLIDEFIRARAASIEAGGR